LELNCRSVVSLRFDSPLIAIERRRFFQ
jgi:hypothetical protein